MNKQIEEFKESENKRGISNLTVHSYISDIKLFIKYLDKNEITLTALDPAEAEEEVNNYVIYLLSNNYKATSINRKILSITKFLKFLNKEVHIDFLKIHKMQILENVITKDEINKLLEVCKSKRDRAIMLTLSKMGLRVSELLELKVRDVAKSSVELKGKRGKYRTVVVPATVKEAWKEYLQVRPKTNAKQLFVGKRGPIKRQAVNYMLLKYQKNSKVKRKKVHPHSFRHSCFKSLSDAGVGIEVIADIAGHESLDTTRIYTRRSKEELKKLMDM